MISVLNYEYSAGIAKSEKEGDFMRKLSGKKLLTATLLAATFAFGLVGCGSDDTSSEDAGVSEENVVDEADAEESVDTSELKPFRIGATGQDGGGVFESAALAVENGCFESYLFIY